MGWIIAPLLIFAGAWLVDQLGLEPWQGILGGIVLFGAFVVCAS